MQRHLNILEEHRMSLVLWRRNHPGFAPQLLKIQKTIDKMTQQCAFLIRQYELSNKKIHMDKADAILEEATALMKKLKNYELLATLSGN
jgi:septation ring formation regulator EzrA